MAAFAVLSGLLPSAESNLEEYVQVSGRISGKAITMACGHEGIVEHLAVRPGDRVEAGAVLFRVGQPELQERLGILEETISRLEQEKLARLEHLASLQPYGAVSLEMAEAVALNAAIELSMAECAASRGEAGAGGNPGVRTVYDLQALRERYKLSTDRLFAVKEIIGEIEEAAGKLSLVESQVEELVRERRGLLFTARLGEVSAPTMAVVREVWIEEGQQVTRGQNLIELVPHGPYLLEAFLGGDMGSRIAEGQQALIYPHVEDGSPPHGQAPVRAVVEEISPGRAKVWAGQCTKGHDEGYRIQLRLPEGEGLLGETTAEAIIPIRAGGARTRASDR
jgi:multidrug resistance efflux pump